MKRKVALLLAGIMGTSAVLGMGGCGNKGTEELVKKKEQTSADTENTSGEKTKLVFLRSGTEPERKAYWEKMIAGFEKENPNIEIEFQECPYGDDFETKLNTGFASGTAPDIINFTMASLGTRVPLGQYAALDEYVDKWDGKDDFMENALNLGKVNGKIYGIAVFPDPRMLAYNKELFKEAGLDPDTPPATWQEMLDDHKKLIKKDDSGTVVQTGFAMPTSGTSMQHYMSIFIEENGVKNLVDEDNNEILCNSDKAVEAVAFMKEVADAGVIPFDCSNSEQDPFGMGTAGMGIVTDQTYKQLNEGALKGKIALASPLKNTQQATFCGMSFMFMSGETKHKDEVWKFIEYVSSPESMWTRYEDLGTTPIRESLKEKFIEQDPETNQVIYDSINCGTGSPKVPYATSVYNIINEAMEKVMYDVETPKDAMDTAAEKIQEEINNQ